MEQQFVEPLVSVGVPVFNGASYVEQAIGSVLMQTYQNIEVIVSDNGSTDDSRLILERLSLSDPRVKLSFSPENLGASWNFNRVLSLANGQYFKWLAHDDMIEPDFVRRAVEVLESDDDVSLCYSQVRQIGADGATIGVYDFDTQTSSDDPVQRIKEMLLNYGLCYEIFGLIRRSALDKTRGMGSFSHGDGVLLVELAGFGRFHEIRDRLLILRSHPSQSMSLFRDEVSSRNDYRAYASWFDPLSTRQRIYPHWRILIENLRAINGGPLGWSGRLRCWGLLARWVGVNRRNLARDILLR